MTIAIGAKYPLPEFNRLLGSDAKIPEAVILVSDSRWTLEGSTQYYDIGTKLFRLGREVGAVYAGQSEVGERCLSELRQRLANDSGVGHLYTKELAQETFQEIYCHYLATKHTNTDKCPLYILIGACNTLGRAQLHLFKYDKAFEAEEITDVKGIGIDWAVEQVKRALKKELDKLLEEEISTRHRLRQGIQALRGFATVPRIFINPHDIAIITSAVLDNFVKSGVEERVGGKVQCALVTIDEFCLQKIFSTTAPITEAPTRITAKPEELKTVTGTFGCYSLSD